MYRQRARFIEGSEAQQEISWALAKPNSKPLPFPTRINSLVWANSRDVKSQGIGEVPNAKKTHVKSGTVSKGLSKCIVGKPQWFLTGIPKDVYDNAPDTLPDCCGATLPPDIQGGNVFLEDGTQFVATNCPVTPPTEEICTWFSQPQFHHLLMNIHLPWCGERTVRLAYDGEFWVSDFLYCGDYVWHLKLINCIGGDWNAMEAILIEDAPDPSHIQVTQFTASYAWSAFGVFVNVLDGYDANFVVTLDCHVPFTPLAEGQQYLDSDVVPVVVHHLGATGSEYLVSDVVPVVVHHESATGSEYLVSENTSAVGYIPYAIGRQYLGGNMYLNVGYGPISLGREVPSSTTSEVIGFAPPARGREVPSSDTTGTIVFTPTTIGREYLTEA